MKSINLVFPTLIYKASLESLTNDIVDSCIEYMNADSICQTKGNGFYTKDQYIMENLFLQNVKNEICEVHLPEYIKLLGHKVSNVSITSSWGNIIKQNDVIMNHIHANSYISGVFYLTDGSSLSFFRDPVGTQFMFDPMVEYDSNNPCTFTQISMPASKGSIVLFPSLLKHSVDVNEMNHDRYSIAINTIPKCEFGSITNKINLE